MWDRCPKNAILPEPPREGPDVSPVVHGGPDAEELRRLGLDPARVLDFSVNTNPYGPSPHVREAVSRASLECYPDREARALRQALAEVNDVSPDRIVVGNGSSELLWLAALAFLRPGDRALVLGPTFGEYARAVALVGAGVLNVQAREENDFTLEPGKVECRLNELEPRLVFLANPNNPTGTALPCDLIAGWAERYPGTLFVVDEAYLAFAPGLQSAAGCPRENVLVLRSMTKDYALAGLRLGYAIGRAEVVAALARVRPPWSVNALAQAAGIAALRDQDHQEVSLAQLGRAKAALAVGLAEQGRKVVPSAAHFFLLHVGEGASCRRALLRRGILVRDCASFGLPAYVRIATRRPEENARLPAALREVMP